MYLTFATAQTTKIVNENRTRNKGQNQTDRRN